jgi:hemerythrin-like domain-containing protein
MLYYIKAFPETLHHPKEDAHLFRKLRARTHDFDATLDELERQHVEGHQLVEELGRSIAAYETDPKGGFAQFAATVERFATSQMEHMALEVKVIIPAARRHLSEADWVEIGSAFAGNSDPRFSVDNDEEFRQLFARIMNLAPESMVGAAGNARA